MTYITSASERCIFCYLLRVISDATDTLSQYAIAAWGGSAVVGATSSLYSDYDALTPHTGPILGP